VRFVRVPVIDRKFTEIVDCSEAWGVVKSDGYALSLWVASGLLTPRTKLEKIIAE
jgi:hypothetical protein